MTIQTGLNSIKKHMLKLHISDKYFRNVHADYIVYL